MKLVTSLDYITNIQTQLFKANLYQDEVLYYKYQQKTPYSLLIMIDYSHNELVLEFSGKILLEHYPQLINIDTIGECIDNINKLAVCSLDRDNIISNANVVKCDVTMDVEADVNKITSTVKQNLINYSRWSTKPYNNGVVVENIVSTPKYKKRLTIYEKSKELNQGSSKHFLNSLSNRDEVLDYYKNKVRFELNINTMSQVRQMLNIPDNQIQSVLKSTANPILRVIDEAVKYRETKIRAIKLRDYERELLLKECDYDLAKVEVKVREYSKKSTSITKAMQPYKDLFHQLKSDKESEIDIRKLVS